MLNIFRFSYELSPIFLTNGVAQGVPGGLPIVLFTQGISFLSGILGGGSDLNPDDFFAHFWPLPGSTLANNQFGKYPFANQQIAANARIKMPARIALRMVCPARGDLAYGVKLATMTALKMTIDLHDSLGGTYTVATPSFIYANCVLLSLTDTSHGDSTQPQNTYTWEFEQPLLTLEDAAQAQSNLMNQISGGLPLSQAAIGALKGVGSSFSAWFGLGGASANNPSSLGSVGLVPSASGVIGAQTAQPFTGINQ